MKTHKTPAQGYQHDPDTETEQAYSQAISQIHMGQHMNHSGDHWLKTAAQTLADLAPKLEVTSSDKIETLRARLELCDRERAEACTARERYHLACANVHAELGGVGGWLASELAARVASIVVDRDRWRREARDGISDAETQTKVARQERDIARESLAAQQAENARQTKETETWRQLAGDANEANQDLNDRVEAQVEDLDTALRLALETQRRADRLADQLTEATDELGRHDA